MSSPRLVMSGVICRAICEYKRSHPDCTLPELQRWLSETYRQRLCLSTISDILKLNISSLNPPANFYFGDGTNQDMGVQSEDEDEDEDEDDMTWYENYQMKAMSSGRFVMSEEIIKALFSYKKDHPQCTLTELRDWLAITHHHGLLLETIAEIVQPGPKPSANFYLGDGSNQDKEPRFLYDYEGSEEEEEVHMISSEDYESDTEEDDEEMEDQEKAITLTDPTLLDCSYCSKPLTIPVYQCDEKGHVLCSPCCSRKCNKCPICLSNIGQIRCQLVEKLIESLKEPCQNKKYGCGEMLNHYNKEHEKTCPHSPCSCPLPGCNFEGSFSSLHSHFNGSHIFATPVFKYNGYNSLTLARGQRYVVFGGEDSSIFVLTRFSEVGTSAINVVRIAPSNSDRFCYEIKVKIEETSAILQSSVVNTTKWEGCQGLPGKNFLLVPDYFATPEGQLHLQLGIRRV